MNSFKLLAIVAVLFCNACATDFGGDGVFDSGENGATDQVATTNVTGTPAATKPADVPAEVTKTKIFGDLDGDGFSPALGNDCDETNPSIHKFADETCNGIDDNCDDKTDEGLTQQVFADHDQDGYGLSSEATTVCITETHTPPKGYSFHDGDCNDSAEDKDGDGKIEAFWINRDATETCDDGIDNNCSDGIDEMCPVVPKDLETGDNFGIVVIWPSEKVGQKIMAVEYYSQAEIGAPFDLLEASATSNVMVIVPDGNACGVRFNTAYGKPKASEWLCMDDKINPDVAILVIKADGTVLDVTKLVKKWTAPEGGCSANLELHECK